MAQVYTFKITYQECGNKIWRTFEVSSNYDLASLGYMVLASFRTMAYHLFSIECKGIEYETDIENYGEYPLLREQKLSNLNLIIGEHMQMIYDFGCEQMFDIELIDISEMPRGSGRSYPRVIDGEGKGIIDDMSAYELSKIIKETDKNGKSNFEKENSFGDMIIWDYRDYKIDYDNCLLKGEISMIREAYETESD